MRIHIDMNREEIISRISRQWDAALHPLTEQIMADCNRYCKEDTGALIASSQTHSQPKKGLIVWQTPYARRQYYAIPGASVDINPLARWKWADYAKSAHLADWQTIAQRLFNG